MKIGKTNRGSGPFNTIVFISMKILMFFIYFLIFTPIGFFIRIIGNDLLRLKFSSNIKTYWIKRIKILSSMNKQY